VNVQQAGQNVDDTQIIPMAVHAEMTAGLHDGAADTKLSALHAFDLFAGDNRREDDRIINPVASPDVREDRVQLHMAPARRPRPHYGVSQQS
jgi:hypothetical protein